MKKIRIMLGMFCVLLFAASCTNKKNEKTATDINAYQMVQYIKDSQKELPEMKCLTKKSEEYKDMAATLYPDLDHDKVEDAAMQYSTGATPDEITVIKTSDTKKVKEVFEKRMEERKGTFTGYMPQAVAVIEKGKIVEEGDYIALLICDDPDAAKKAFEECFDQDKSAEIKKQYEAEQTVSTKSPAESPNVTEEPTPAPSVTEEPTPAPTEFVSPEVSPEPGKEMSDQAAIEQPFMKLFDNSRIVKAYKTNDESCLIDEKEKKIYAAAVKVIQSEIKEGMTEYEKEVAIHDYIAKNMDYDKAALSNSGKPSKDSNTPYGGLINGNIICIGYANTFQLFMDMLDIKSVVVMGKAYNYMEYHAWNKVCLDGEWYNVDVTWDDPLGGDGVYHEFFNVTDQEMEISNHQWCKEDYPEAAGEKYAYKE